MPVAAAVLPTAFFTKPHSVHEVHLCTRSLYMTLACVVVQQLDFAARAWVLSSSDLPLSRLDCRWLDAARYGKLHNMRSLLKASGQHKAALVAYDGAGTSYGLMGHTALHWAAAKVPHMTPVFYPLQSMNLFSSQKNRMNVFRFIGMFRHG